MTEVACENNGKCDVDQRSFKAYLSRFMAYTAAVAPWTRSQLDPYIQASAQAAAKQCTGGVNQTSCGLRWIDGGANDGSFGVGEEMSAMEIIQSLLYPNRPGPVTMDKGGVSKSNPNAGDTSTDTVITFNVVTTADRAGAAILTILVLVMILVGAWWMVA